MEIQTKLMQQKTFCPLVYIKQIAIMDYYNIYCMYIQENYTYAERIVRGQKAAKRTQKASTSIKGANLFTSQK